MGQATAAARDLGGWLRSLRERSGLSQTELAASVGTDRRNIRRWELEGHDPGGSMLIKVLSALGVTVQPAPPEDVPRAVNVEVQELERRLARVEDTAARRHDELLAHLDAQAAELRALASRVGAPSSRPE